MTSKEPSRHRGGSFHNALNARESILPINGNPFIIISGAYIHASTLIVITLLVFALAYRYYAQFIITIVLVLNSSLATLALSIGTIFILRHSGKWQYALVTFVPSLFMFVTTFAAGIENVTDNYLPKHTFQGNLNAVLTIIMLVLVLVIYFESMRKSIEQLRSIGKGSVQMVGGRG
jgi:carbon starvation protein CstA